MSTTGNEQVLRGDIQELGARESFRCGRRGRKGPGTNIPAWHAWRCPPPGPTNRLVGNRVRGYWHHRAGVRWVLLAGTSGGKRRVAKCGYCVTMANNDSVRVQRRALETALSKATGKARKIARQKLKKFNKKAPAHRRRHASRCPHCRCWAVTRAPAEPAPREFPRAQPKLLVRVAQEVQEVPPGRRHGRGGEVLRREYR